MGIGNNLFVVWGVVVGGVVAKAFVLVSDGVYPKCLGQYPYFLWSYKDFRNNGVVIGVCSCGYSTCGCGSCGCGSLSGVVRSVVVVVVRAYPESFR